MITTRNAIGSDKDFLWRLKVAAMRNHIELAYGWNDETQYKFFENRFQPKGIQIIRYGDQDVGMYELQEHDKYWFLARIEILPEFQNRGIGSTIIQRMIDDATIADKPLRLQVFKANPAQSLYERLGFVKTDETETHIEMECAITEKGKKCK
ncbi:MAG: GNAT family N-acetyltransferase [Candidatus Promineifilaceae bacterium]|jgi:ribosomal protein S18 acetylase RimI-like enzyme